MSIRRGHLAAGFALLLIAGAGLLPSLLLAGIDPESNTDGYDPVAANNNINEARRRNAISRQIETNYQMLWNGGWFPAGEPVRQPIGHESKQIGPNRWLYRPIYPEDVAQPVETLPTDELLPDPSQGPLLVPPTGPANPSKPPAALLPSPVSPPPSTGVPSGPKSQQLAPPAPAGAQPSDYIPPRSSSRKPRQRGPRAF